MSKWFSVKLILLTFLSSTPLSISTLDSNFLSTWKGIHIVPMDNLNVPIIVKKAMLATQKQMDTQGYVESNDNEATFLLNIDKRTKDSKQIFAYPLIGNCAYSQTEIISIELSKESTTYLINNKPTSVLVQGNVRDGFLYAISWYAGALMKTLECANRKYDKRMVDHMVALGNKLG